METCFRTVYFISYSYFSSAPFLLSLSLPPSLSLLLLFEEKYNTNQRSCSVWIDRFEVKQKTFKISSNNFLCVCVQVLSRNKHRTLWNRSILWFPNLNSCRLNNRAWWVQKCVSIARKREIERERKTVKCFSQTYYLWRVVSSFYLPSPTRCLCALMYLESVESHVLSPRRHQHEVKIKITHITRTQCVGSEMEENTKNIIHVCVIVTMFLHFSINTCLSMQTNR